MSPKSSPAAGPDGRSILRRAQDESFNVLKNHGYELAHNFGHGKQFPAINLAAFNLLAFAWHSILDLLEPPWQKAREAAGKRTSFFASIIALTTYLIFPDWPTFLESLASFEIPENILKSHNFPT